MSREKFKDDWVCIECGTLQSKHNQWFDGVCEVCHENTQIDLFEHYEQLPKEVNLILEKYLTGDNSYENCKALEKELTPLGYEFDYGLDAEPYNLRKKLVLDCPLCNCALTQYIEDSDCIRECDSCGAEWESDSGSITLDPKDL